MTRYTPLWLQQGSYPAGIDRRLISAIWPSIASKGGALTKVAGTMTASIAPGSYVVPTANGTGSTLCVWDAAEVVTFAPAPGSGLSRYDTVYIQARGNDIDGGANNDFIFGVVTGTAAASPSVPAAPAGSQGLFALLIPGGVASLDTATVAADWRPSGLGPAASYYSVASDQSVPAAAFTTLAANTGKFDTLGGYNTSTHVLTCPAAGIYRVHGSAVTTTTGFSLALNHNGATGDVAGAGDTASPAFGPSSRQSVLTALAQCAQGDTLSVVVYATSAVTVNSWNSGSFATYELLK
jgi:hypothetical protein